MLYPVFDLGARVSVSPSPNLQTGSTQLEIFADMQVPPPHLTVLKDT